MQRVSLVAGHASQDGGPWTLTPSSQPAPRCGRWGGGRGRFLGRHQVGAVTPAGVRSRGFRSRCILGEQGGVLREKAEGIPQNQSPRTCPGGPRTEGPDQPQGKVVKAPLRSAQREGALLSVGRGESRRAGGASQAGEAGAQSCL